MLLSMVTLHSAGGSCLPPGLGNFLWVLVGLFVVFFAPNTQQLMGRAWAGFSVYRHSTPVLRAGLRWRPHLAWGFFMGLIFAVCLFGMSSASEFLYFKF